MIKKILILLMLLPVYLLAWKMESGTIILNDTTVNPNWTTVTLKQTYDTTPLIFALPDEGSGHNGDDPAALRIQNITTSGFEILQVEPNNQDGLHSDMNVSYIAIEPGEYTLNGAKIIASTIPTQKVQANTNTGYFPGLPTEWENISFPLSSFNSSPVVLGMIQGLANENNNIPNQPSSVWLTVAMDNVTAGGFDVALERAEVNDGALITNDETIAYLAIDGDIQGSLYDTQCNNIEYETILETGVQGWGNGCYQKNFQNTYASFPNVIGKQTTRNGNNGGWLRRCDIDTDFVGLTIDEDIFADTERNHIAENVALFVFANDFVYDSSKTLNCGLVAEYRLDECYWLNNSATPGDVKDNSVNAFHGTSSGTVQPVTDAQIGRSSGDFSAQNGISDGFISVDHDTAFEFADEMTISAWVNADVLGNDWSVIASKFSSQSWTDGWGLFHWGGHTDEIGFIIFTPNYSYVEATVTLNQWTHIVGKYDGTEIKLYVDGVEISSAPVAGSISNSITTFDIGAGKTGAGTNEPFEGKIDEVKIWNRALSDQEIANMESNESIGNNYDGTTRAPVTCNATVNANSWELVGIPIDLRTDPKTVTETFQGMTGTYGTDWRIYRRDYSDTNNSSWYTYLDDPDNNMTEFGKGYWLGNASSTTETWDVNGTQAVEYDSTHPDCPANQCVEIDVKSVSLDFTTDPNDGTGPYQV